MKCDTVQPMKALTDSDVYFIDTNSNVELRKCHSGLWCDRRGCGGWQTVHPWWRGRMGALP